MFSSPLPTQLHNCEADRAALVQLVSDLTKRLAGDEEFIIPPSLVKCFEEFSIKGLISLNGERKLKQDAEGLFMTAYSSCENNRDKHCIH